MAPIYSDEFRRDTVRIATISGLTRPLIASDLGIGVSTLNKWVQHHQNDDLMSGPHEEVEKENARLRKENRLLREEREVLKKAMIVTFFKSLKAELIWRQKWETRRQAEEAIFQYINGFYNPRRQHLSLSWKSPLAFERRAA